MIFNKKVRITTNFPQPTCNTHTGEFIDFWSGYVVLNVGGVHKLIANDNIYLIEELPNDK